MNTSPTPSGKSHKKLWIAIAIVAACAIIGIIIWKMIAVNPHVI